MMNCSCHHGHFFVGMTAGLVIGTAFGMTMTPSRREIKRMAHKAAKSVSEAVDTLTDAMSMSK